jgi:hypothetical protein
VRAGGIVGTFHDSGSVSYAYATGSVFANGTGTGNGNSSAENDVSIAACGIVGGNSTQLVRYTVALNSSISIDSGCYYRNYKTLAFRISTAHYGNVNTDGATNYGKSDLTPAGDQSHAGLLNEAQNLSQNGTNVTVSGGPLPAAYTAPDQTWWTTMGFRGADWTTVWEWDSVKGLPVLQ